MIDLKLSRQLIKIVYLRKLEYEKDNNEKITMSEFIEECLMEYLDISIIDINTEKVPIRLDMYYEDCIYKTDTIINYTDTKTDTNQDINLDEDIEDISFVNYVYVYMNPFKKLENEIILDICGEKFKFDYEPFYIGKGKGNRMFEHLKSNKSDVNKDKIDIINEIIYNQQN